MTHAQSHRDRRGTIALIALTVYVLMSAPILVMTGLEHLKEQSDQAELDAHLKHIRAELRRIEKRIDQLPPETLLRRVDELRERMVKIEVKVGK